MQTTKVYKAKAPTETKFGWGFSWRREWDSNPRLLAESLVFKTSSLNHSDISPYKTPYYSTSALKNQSFILEKKPLRENLSTFFQNILDFFSCL